MSDAYRRALKAHIQNASLHPLRERVNAMWWVQAILTLLLFTAAIALAVILASH